MLPAGPRLISSDSEISVSYIYIMYFQVGLVSPGEMTPYCGGSIITSSHILTAAHCVFDSNTNDVKEPASLQVSFCYLI